MGFSQKHTWQLIAINSKKISISLRPRVQPNKFFTATIVNYQRENPLLKNLYYKKIISLLEKNNNSNNEVIKIGKIATEKQEVHGEFIGMMKLTHRGAEIFKQNFMFSKIEYVYNSYQLQ